MTEPTQYQFNPEQDAPLLHLITKDPSTMTDQELIEHRNKLRALLTSSQTQKASIKKSPKKKKNFSHLLG